MQSVGFYSNEQELNFRAANILHRRGGALEVVCGARTRTGGTCKGKPLLGSKRCLRHAGPHAARAFRIRQIRDLARGKITPAEFAANEARRAVNRLRDNWKKNPWFPGSTIDLGEHEWAFQQESGLVHSNQPIAPAVLDWLRWKYRRQQIDRKRDNEWLRVLREELPVRVRNAGPPSDADLMSIEQQKSGATLAVWTTGEESPFSKRRKLDNPIAVKPTKTQVLRSMNKVPVDEQEMARIASAHWKMLKRLNKACHDEGERRAVLIALHNYSVRPDDRASRETWVRTLITLRARH